MGALEKTQIKFFYFVPSFKQNQYRGAIVACKEQLFITKSNFKMKFYSKKKYFDNSFCSMKFAQDSYKFPKASLALIRGASQSRNIKYI